MVRSILCIITNSYVSQTTWYIKLTENSCKFLWWQSSIFLSCMGWHWNGCLDLPPGCLGGTSSGELNTASFSCLARDILQRLSERSDVHSRQRITTKDTCSMWLQKPRSIIPPACKEIPQTNRLVTVLFGPNVLLPPNLPWCFISSVQVVCDKW